MSLLRAEHGGAIGVLLVLFAIQIYKNNEDVAAFGVDVWIDNKEVLSRGDKATMGDDLNAQLVFDFD